MYGMHWKHLCNRQLMGHCPASKMLLYMKMSLSIRFTTRTLSYETSSYRMLPRTVITVRHCIHSVTIRTHFSIQVTEKSFFKRESRMLRASLPSSGRPSVRLSHSWSVSKWCKLGSRNLHYGLPQGL